jgi:uncharacterized protein YydD (DUF2326 family)
MIHELWSDRASFKRLRFGRGLNIVLAARSGVTKETISEDQGRTRNGAGKSSLIDILRFMLGGDVQRKKTIVAAPVLKDDNFFLSFDLMHRAVTVTRSPSGRGRVKIQGDFADWPIQPDVNKKTGEVTMSGHSWTDLLGRTFFGLPPASQTPPGSNLSFASCIAYFIRRSRDGAFAHWATTHRSQSHNRVSVPLSFLFGLDTDIALRFLRADETAKSAQELRRAIAQGMLANTVGSSAQVRSGALRARRRVERLRSRLEGQEVLDFYGSYEAEAAQLDARIRELNDENYTDQQLIIDLEHATREEAAPGIPDLERLYKEAHVVLPEVSLRRYEEVQIFHDQVISNRRNHLRAEIDAARNRLDSHTRERDRLLVRHREILGLLSSGVSAGHYRRLERELIDAETESKDLEKRLELAERIEQARVDVKAQRIEAEREVLQELSERRSIVDEAAGIFMDISSELYEKPATLELKSTPNGLRFLIERPDLPSEGVAQMQIFTFDLTLATMCARRGVWPGFLVHDSHIFDGVDGRQIGHALEVARRHITKLNGQYIVTMNSDDLEKAKTETGLDFQEHVVTPVLDDTDTGGLFGFPFDYDMSDAAIDDSSETPTK